MSGVRAHGWLSPKRRGKPRRGKQARQVVKAGAFPNFRMSRLDLERRRQFASKVIAERSERAGAIAIEGGAMHRRQCFSAAKRESVDPSAGVRAVS